MNDSFGRKIDYLRISVTDRCNLRCIYCMPESGIPHISHSDILRLEEILYLTKLIDKALDLRKIRITGGEPLVRHGIVTLVEGLSALAETVMTTNGILLPEFASKLRKAGLSRVNISIDSLRDDVLENVTRRRTTLDMIESAIVSAGENSLNPVKMNCVVLDGVNTGELAAMVRWAKDMAVTMRFIEHMPMTGSLCGYVSRGEILREISGELGQVERIFTEGTAEMYSTRSGEQFGIIAPVEGEMCADCTRLRLTAEGELLPCLSGGESINLRAMLRNGSSDSEIIESVVCLVKRKPHHGACGGVRMWRIGG
jgi:cyclic pyranopterin phosphate synthase